VKRESTFTHGDLVNCSVVADNKRKHRQTQHWIFLLPTASSRTMALVSIQPLIEMSTRNLPGGKGQLARKADNFTAICELIV
jgi:hypothetical protein